MSIEISQSELEKLVADCCKNKVDFRVQNYDNSQESYCKLLRKYYNVTCPLAGELDDARIKPRRVIYEKQLYKCTKGDD